MSKKANERAERAEKDRAKKARKAQEKTEGAERDRVESIRQGERTRVFQEFLSGTDKSKGCCEPCNYHVRTSNGEYQPCKMGHKDSGPDKEVCADCSFTHYHPKK